jgi:hypothetical protein
MVVLHSASWRDFLSTEERMARLKLRCYVCGKLLSKLGDFALVSPSPSAVDRAFVVHGGDCLKRVREDHPHVEVRLHG